MKQLPIMEHALKHGDRVALSVGTRHSTYAELVERSESVAIALLDGRDDLNESRVAFLIPAGFDYVTTLWGIWRAGGVAVPLSLSATDRELDYAIGDAQVSVVVSVAEQQSQLSSICDQRHARLITTDGISDATDRRLADIESDGIDPSRHAMILYTSGTTSTPKGVVTTHRCIQAQIESLIKAWHWQADDRIPLFLPLHHIHGIINVMSCALWSGATIEAFPRFDLETVLRRVSDNAYTVFMAVPTIYVKLIEAIESSTPEARTSIVAGFAGMRLMVSGSAALPASVHQKWTELTGQELLERYGMTEIGMALSNPYDGERRPGAVGRPLPGVEIRLQEELGDPITQEDLPGEIQVRGPNVFAEYWNRAEATADSFQDGWFRTGDIAVLESGYYRIMGRSSVDIIKSGGYKLSALEIEAALLDHPSIRECAVVGVSDETWGEVVAAAVVLESADDLGLDGLQSWCKQRISHYKIPRKLVCVDKLPRNAMGKVTKPDVLKLITAAISASED